MSNTEPKRILVIAVPGIGDALLATPLIRSLKLSWPNVEIDVAVREGRRDILVGNPDVSEIIEVERRPPLKRSLRTISRMFRRYDLSFTTSPNDRWVLMCVLTARRSFILLPRLKAKSAWKWLLGSNRTAHREDELALLCNLRLAESLGIALETKVVVPRSESSPSVLKSKLPFDWESEPYAVIHMLAGFTYKNWIQEYWVQTAGYLASRGIRVVLTSGPADVDIEYVSLACEAFPEGTVSVAGELSFADTSELISSAQIYLGPDTSTTHLAAACNTPTIAIFGSTNYEKWAPWPAERTERTSPIRAEGFDQRYGNVRLLRGECPCRPYSGPCRVSNTEESSCLRGLLPENVIVAINEFLD